jgi:hypothetical protein
VDIAAFLLERDFIEKLGVMETRGDVMEELAARASNETHYPPTYIKEGLTDIVNLGSLKCEIYDGKVAWKWA